MTFTHAGASERLHACGSPRLRLARLVRSAVVLFAAALSAAMPARAQDETPKPHDLASQSLEDLMNVEVTSVSKKEEKLSQIASAVFVITQEDIRRSGATNVPDLLRMVPGLDVAQVNGSTWAIGARGFNQQFSDKLLVIIDGRIVYTPNFAGTYWDTVDLPLENIDRIEVIRGPGGSVWGANAVNGVISIFTKKASEMQGGLVEADGGSLVQGAGVAEYGAKLSATTDATFYTKYFNQGAMTGLDGGNGADGWHMWRSGFRSDSAVTSKDNLTLEGELYAGREGELGYVLPSVTSPTLVGVPEQIDLDGGFLVADWAHAHSARTDSDFHIAYTRNDRKDPQEPETRDTLNVDYKLHTAWGDRQDLVLGAGYQITADAIGGSFTVFFAPASRSLQTVDTFVQDEIQAIPDRLYVTLGTKFEHNDYTGFNVMPSARVAWLPTPRQTVWAAVSRALRTPSRNDTNLVVNLGSTVDSNGNVTLEQFDGNPDFQNEKLIAYEAGYRRAFDKDLTLDVAAYFNDYGNLATTEPSTSTFANTPPPPHAVQTFTYENLMYGETSGIEIAANWKALPRWTITPSYALEELHLHTKATSQDAITPLFMENGSPQQTAQLRSHLEITRSLSWDAAGYFNDRLSHQGLTADQVIPAYTRVDTSLTWKFLEHGSLSLVGQNLAKDHHLEFEDVFGSMQSGAIKRSAYVRASWRF